MIVDELEWVGLETIVIFWDVNDFCVELYVYVFGFWVVEDVVELCLRSSMPWIAAVIPAMVSLAIGSINSRGSTKPIRGCLRETDLEGLSSRV